MNNASTEAGRCAPRVLDWVESPLGPLILAATAEAICLLEFSHADRLEGRLAALRQRYAQSIVPGTSAGLQDLRRQLSEYFSCKRRGFDVQLAYPGTSFQQQVWTALLEIPYGETWSYLDVAKRIGDPGSTRAVGAANGMNPIAIVVPCHRVINADGKLGGYGGGLWRKRILLDLERGQGSLFV